MTVSDKSKLESSKERCEEFEDKAEEAEDSDFRESAKLYLRAAGNAKNVEELEEREKVAESWRERRQTLEKKARVMMARANLRSDEDSPEGNNSSKDPRLDPKSSSSDEPDFFQDPPEKSFSDVGGLDELKEVLRSQVLKPLENPEFYEQQGVGINNGVLLYGPPGTGKTYISKSLAGEIGYKYAGISASDLVSKFVGEAPQNVAELFDEALEAEPCVIFLDEIDALASKRGGQRETRSERQMVNELLEGMQSVQGSEVLVIAATNTVDDLDGALKRSGRFNETFFVGPPDRDARREIFQVHLNEREVDWEAIEWGELLEWSEGFSGADIGEVVRKAARYSAEESTEKDQLVPIKYRHLLEAVKKTEASLKHWDGESRPG
jgi:transitional endoplasmic reticulum ATPase